MRKPITKVKDFIRDNKLLSISILLVFVILIYSMFSPFLCPVEDVVAPSQTTDTYSGQTIGKINTDTIVEGTFTSSIARLDSISIVYATYGDTVNEGTLKVEIYDYNDELIYLYKYELNDLDDNDELTFEFDRQKDSLNREYKIVLTVEELEEDKDITFYAIDKEDNVTTSSELEEVSGSLYITQHGEDYSYYYTVVLLVLYSILLFFAMYKYYKNNKIKFNKMRIILQFIISFLFAICVLDLAMDISYEGRISYISFPILILSIPYIIRNITIFCNREKVERLFLMVAMPLSMLFLVCMIPQYVPDFVAHYSSVYHVSKGNFLFTRMSYEYLNYITSYKELKEIFFNSALEQSTIVSRLGAYNPLLYLPSGLGMFIAGLFSDSILQGIYVGILFNLIVYLIVGYYAIRLMPNKKHFLMIYMLNPMYLQQAISLSADSIIFASCILFICYIFYLKNSNEDLTTKNIVMLSILSFMVFISKFSYFPLLLLLLLIKDKLLRLFSKTNWKKIFPMVIVIVIGLIFLWIYKLSGTSVSSTSLLIDGIVVPQTSYTKMQYLMLNPFKIIYIAINTIILKGDFYLYSFVGTSLGRFEIEIPNYVAVIYIVTLVLSFLIDKSDELKKIDKRVIIVTVLFNLAVIFGALYLGWGEFREIYVEGVQGRYLIPLIILVFLMINSNSFKYKGNNHKMIISLSIIFVNLVTIGYIIQYFL